MVRRRKALSVPKVRPHFEDDEYRLHVLVYLIPLPEDHPAVETFNRDRCSLEVVRAFETEEEQLAMWAVIKPAYEEWTVRNRKNSIPNHSSW